MQYKYEFNFYLDKYCNYFDTIMTSEKSLNLDFYRDLTFW